MKLKLLALTLTVALMAFTFNHATPVMAQTNQAQFIENMALLNQTPVTRNPRLKTDDELFDYRIIDSNSQLIGKLSDLIVDQAGRIERIGSLVKTKVREPRVIYKPYSAQQFRDDISAFEVPVIISSEPTENEEAATAAALASLEPSSGGASYSIKDMVGQELTTPDGRFLGEIKSVVFNDNVTRIEALLLKDVPGARRGKEVAVPYNENEMSFHERFGRLEINLSYERAQDLRNFAKTLR